MTLGNKTESLVALTVTLRVHKAGMFLSVLKDYLVNSTFHGLRFIAEDGRHWTERLFWLVCCLLSWFGSAVLVLSSWESFQKNAISFVVETTYLEVETSFPSISVCEDDNMDRIYAKANGYFGPDHDCNLDEMLREIAYFKGSVYYIKEFCLSDDIGCPMKGYKKMADEVRSPCKDIFKMCSWKNKTFDCCSHFRPLPTEYGTCYTLSPRTEQAGTPDFINLKSSTRLGIGSLHIELVVPAKVYMHTQADIPHYNTMTTDVVTAKARVLKRMGISVTDIENEPEVKSLSISQRGCRFPDENTLTASDVYSYSACVTQCRLQAQLTTCNCTSHLMPRTDERQHCNMQGVLCLSKFSEPMSVQKTPWGSKEGLDCPCLPGCEDPEFDIIETVMTELSEEWANISIIEISLYRYPNERYKRNVVRGRLDLVVSMGGAAGLFVGASLLSFAELFYFFTVRAYNTHATKKKSQKPLTPILVNPFEPHIYKNFIPYSTLKI